MKGVCGEEFKLFSSRCEECTHDQICSKMYKDFIAQEEKEQAIGDNHPLIPDVKLLNKELEEIYSLTGASKISQNDINDLKIDLELYGRMRYEKDNR
jgi:hypothetical protein